MLRIRLTRMGAKKKPFYRVIIKEKRSKRDGKYLENLGFYNPMTDPPKAKLNHERIEYWIGKGAKPTKTVASLIKHNPRLLEDEMEKAETKELAGLKNKKDGAIKEARKRSKTEKKEPEKVVVEEMGDAREDSVKAKEASKKKDGKSKDAAEFENIPSNDKKSESSVEAETASASDVEAKKVEAEKEKSEAKENKAEEALLEK